MSWIISAFVPKCFYALGTQPVQYIIFWHSAMHLFNTQIKIGHAEIKITPQSVNTMALKSKSIRKILFRKKSFFPSNSWKCVEACYERDQITRPNEWSNAILAVKTANRAMVVFSISTIRFYIVPSRDNRFRPPFWCFSWLQWRRLYWKAEIWPTDYFFKVRTFEYSDSQEQSPH